MIFLILTLAFILRLIIINQSLWLDEAINVLAAKNLGFWHFVTGYPIGDFHPPGYFVVLWIWSHIFGFSELSVRFPSIIFGLITVWLTYLIGKELFNKKVGLLAALFLALGPLHIYYSQEARMYAMAAFGGALSFYGLIKLLKNQKYGGLLYIFGLVFVLYSDYLVYLVIPAQFIYVIWAERKSFGKFLKHLSIGSISILPWLAVFPAQLASGRQTAINVPGWEKVVGGSSIKNLLLVGVKSIIGRIKLSENFYIYSALMALIGFFEGIIMYIGVRKFKNEEKLLICWLFIPVILAFVVSWFIPVLSYFRMIFILPALYIILANGVAKLNKKLSYSATGLIILISAISILIYYLNPLYQREDWRGLVNFLKNNSSANSLVLFEDSNLPAPFNYYYKNEFAAQGGLSHFPASTAEDVSSIDVKKYSKIFLVNYLVEISDPNRAIDQKLTSLGYKVIKLDNIPSLGYIYEYSK